MAGAGLCTLSVVGGRDDRSFEYSERVQYLPILGTAPAIYQRCVDTVSNFRLSQRPYERLDAVLMAVVPVPFAWGFAYLALFLRRWIMRGFRARQ